jgi:hypothetical protein
METIEQAKKKVLEAKADKWEELVIRIGDPDSPKREYEDIGRHAYQLLKSYYNSIRTQNMME